MTDSLNYKSAGVDIDAGNALVERLKPLAKATQRAEVLSGLGGFSGLFALPIERYQQPVLVASTDGVGTKLKLAIDWQQHGSVGIDLVAMCANDLITGGAEPLFFLDYYATGQLNVDQATAVIAGIAQGCQQAGMSLLGGETAEMPGMYQHGDYDLAGFCVGVVEREKIITGEQVQTGDVLLGLASSGPHSNGYSLIRKIIADHTLDDERKQQLLAPTKIYVRAVQALLATMPVKAMAHITGGGVSENLPRVLPAHTAAKLTDWEWPEVFTWLQQQGNVARDEMLRTFNCGIGMIIVCTADQVEQATEILQTHGEQVMPLGEIIAHEGDSAKVIYA